MNTKFSVKDRFLPLEIHKLDQSVPETQHATESRVENGRPLVPMKDGDRGAFFKVVLPRGKGPLHIARLIISGLTDGTIEEEIYVLVLYEVIERILAEAIHKRPFRLKWKKELTALVAVSKILPRIRKEGYSRALIKYLIMNRMNQHLDFSKFIVPPKNRDDSALHEIKVIRHREYTPTPKKSTKVPSNSAGTKGSYQPNSISWQSVASQEKIFEKGKWINSRVKTNPSTIDEVS